MANSSSTMSRMGGCLSAIVGAVMAGCGGGNVNGGDALDAVLSAEGASLSMPTVQLSASKASRGD